MKSIRQQLQSRISLRRNTIRDIEAELLEVKRIAYIVKDSPLPFYKQLVRSLKAELAFLRDDQKLDKILYVRLLRDGQAFRLYQAMVSAE
jgi:hypothetical protein